MDASIIDDSEDLYRSVRADSNEYSYQSGKLLFSSTAFDDRSMKPSVDRSAIRTDPTEARRNPTDGIAKILTKDVRQCCSVPIIKNGTPVGDHAVDAIHHPLKMILLSPITWRIHRSNVILLSKAARVSED
jgi:hypothetical protein